MKIMKTLLAGFSAAALLFAASCTNQLDYMNANTNRTAMKVAGLKVTGLDAAYNGATVTLMKVDGDDVSSALVSGKVASSYEDEKGNTVGYKSGTAYIVADDPELLDADKLLASSIEVYLQVGNDQIKTLKADGKLANAKLSLPSLNPGTADEDVPEKWVEVTVTNNCGIFTLADKCSEPVNVTLYNVKLDLMHATKDTLPAGVTVDLADKDAGQVKTKYTVKVKGVKDNAGMKVTLGGDSIFEKDTDTDGNHWHWKESEVFTQTISEEGEVEWTFYGADVSFLAYRSYGPGKGPEFIVAQTGTGENGNRLLESSVSASGGTSDFNLMFPPYAVESGKNVTLTIDVAAVAENSKSKADPVAAIETVYIDGIKVMGAPAIAEAGYYAFCEGWVPNNEWGEATTNKVTKLVNGNAQLVFEEPYVLAPQSEYFSLSIQIMNPVSDAKFWDAKLGGGVITSAKAETASCAGGHYTLVVDGATAKASIVPSSYVLDKISFKVVGIKVINVEALGAAGYIAACEGWVPNNQWNATTPNKSTHLVDGTVTIDFSEAADFAELPLADASKGIQILNPESDEGFWGTKVFEGNEKFSVPGNIDGKKVYMVADAKTKTGTFVITE